MRRLFELERETNFIGRDDVDAMEVHIGIEHIITDTIRDVEPFLESCLEKDDEVLVTGPSDVR